MSQAHATRQRTRRPSEPAVPPPDPSRMTSLLYWSLLLPIAVWLFVPSNGNGNNKAPATAGATGAAEQQQQEPLSTDAPSAVSAIHDNPSAQQQQQPVTAAAALAPALEELLRSMDDEAYRDSLASSSAARCLRSDDHLDADGAADDDENDGVDEPRSAELDVERPLLRRSRAARAKERVGRQRRAVQQKLAGLRRTAETEVNPTGGPLLPILRAIYAFLSPLVLASLYYLFLPLTLPLSLLFVPVRLAAALWSAIAPLAILLLGFAVVGVAWGAAGAGVVRLYKAAIFGGEEDEGEVGRRRGGKQHGRRASLGEGLKGQPRPAPAGDGRWSLPIKGARRRPSRS